MCNVLVLVRNRRSELLTCLRIFQQVLPDSLRVSRHMQTAMCPSSHQMFAASMTQ
jgi:hypothetical protein